MKKFLMLLFVMPLILGLSASALALPIAISNPSFETQTTRSFISGTNAVGTITNWNGATLIDPTVPFGIMNPSAWAGTQMSPDQATAGVNAAWTNGRIFGQWLGVDPLLNYRYTLSVDLGLRLGITNTSQGYTINLVQQTGNNTFAILASLTGTDSTPGTWETAVLVYDALSVTTGNLGIQLDSNGPQILFDNVRLDASPMAPVPEPATMLLLGSGLIGLAGFGRKKLFKKR